MQTLWVMVNLAAVRHAGISRFLTEKLTFMINLILNSFWHEEDGQDMVEYSLLLGFIGLGVVALLSGISTQLTGIWSTVNSTLASTNTAAATPGP